MKKNIITIYVIIFIVLLTVVGASLFVFSTIKPKQKIINSNNGEQKTQIVETKGTKLRGVIIEGTEFNTYRNEEFGFEFKFLRDWKLEENSFGSYYSKFNIVLSPSTGQKVLFPILINVVLPEFADRSFNSVEKITSEIIVDGISGIKHEYEFEGFSETAIILPLGEYKIILGINIYENGYNDFLKTFKFLK
ncbi:MAG: hypothetical protein A2469_04580 [Candidatus Magasanikbacteria bacterium RIFOXYC2_FULL_40_16]|uniref:Uncharacterized protein n=3 Tax=Candidatus Magasanikiibacteriota TaxID=1752731 RepID=A0A1F6NH52_9BACT|nr:MAG: hypothetical protein A2224_02425 [Candidatus Magasanikbacteria bacterium RIFOXYA2_FULL_40_20]OGH83175.1 MAG: hypothetical protein A2373_04515 [Candidatus Magasanikbacteria bacterium RIFOXYB1_FULL_40_15]OGH86661.1 MAG: hypothetical protein A2301_00625 [Candidatus Magasanikbacteria bacterium RIFOXYB2_FULL_40_13]OGH87864.1 MAG: hypothetical protein A2206_01855 [Candidatus Magasanikbacteria bacterium RIFOXYA1_FULL_40_8]OGH89445.1 MAG: hypothetical protein A2469_04580 [Candidatus Magasanikba